MAAPEGIEVSAGSVCRLRRSLYDLKQAAAVRYKTIRSVFRSMEFVQCRAGTCFFVRRNGDDCSRSSTMIVL